VSEAVEGESRDGIPHCTDHLDPQPPPHLYLRPLCLTPVSVYNAITASVFAHSLVQLTAAADVGTLGAENENVRVRGWLRVEGRQKPRLSYITTQNDWRRGPEWR
jgi:hypothetical protein